MTVSRTEPTVLRFWQSRFEIVAWIFIIRDERERSTCVLIESRLIWFALLPFLCGLQRAGLDWHSANVEVFPIDVRPRDACIPERCLELLEHDFRAAHED